MTLEEYLLALWQNGILAAALAVVGWYLNYLLQKDRARRNLAQAIAPMRATAYENLWLKTMPFRLTNPPELTSEERSAHLEEINKAYFEQGGAMYLSHEAAARLLRAKRLLESEDTDPSDIQKAFSEFRTQLKVDLLIYSKRDAERPLTVSLR